MSITAIRAELWPEIVTIQDEVYHDIEPERLVVLQSKWLTSPELCFVYQENEQVLAYLLAHAWNSLSLPKLDHLLPADCHGNIVVLHDLAISKAGHGKGIGAQMVAHLLKTVTAYNYQQIRIVSIQNSKAFWQKQGFHVTAEQNASANYGSDALIMARDL